MATSPPDNAADANESGELLDYNDSSVLEQFHEDALRQVFKNFVPRYLIEIGCQLPYLPSHSLTQVAQSGTWVSVVLVGPANHPAAHPSGVTAHGDSTLKKNVSYLGSDVLFYMS